MKSELNQTSISTGYEAKRLFQLPDIAERELHEIRRSILRKLARRMRGEKCLEEDHSFSNEFAHGES